MNCERSTKTHESESSISDTLKLSAFVRSLSMNKSDATKILGAAREGQKIDVLTITAALWVTGDVEFP